MILYFNLIILLINDQFNQLNADSVNAFRCDSPDLKMEILNFKDHFRRFFLKQNKFYFILQNRIIYSYLPYLNSDNKLEFFNFNQQINREENSTDKVIGHVVHLTNGQIFSGFNSSIYELYYTENRNSSDDQLECGELLFVDKIGERSNSRFCGNLNIYSNVVSPLHNNLKILNNSNLVNWYHESMISNHFFTKLISVGYFKKLKQQKGNLHIIVIQGEQFRKAFGLFEGLIEELDCFIFHLLPNQAIYLNTRPFTEDFKLNILLFGINTDQSKLYFYWLQTYHEFKQIEKLKKITKLLEYEIKFDKLFNCHSKLNHENELKGIYYHNNIFYIFKNRHYLRIENPHLLEDGLKIVDHYYLNSSDLKFQKSIQFMIPFQLDDQLWVKNLNNKSFFLPNSRDEFRIDFNDNELILIENLNQLNLAACRQTFEIDNKIFCFDEQFYFKIPNKHEKLGRKISIDSIFDGHQVGWITNQKLKFIFYHLNNVVFVTEDYLFLFDYKKFKVDQNNLITISFDKDHKIVKYRNYLFDSLIKSYSNESTVTELPATKPDTIKLTTKTTELTKNELTTTELTTTESTITELTKNESSTNLNIIKPNNQLTDDQLIKYVLIGLSIFVLFIAPCFATYLRVYDRISSSYPSTTIRRRRSPFENTQMNSGPFTQLSSSAFTPRRSTPLNSGRSTQLNSSQSIQLNSGSSMVYDTGDDEVKLSSYVKKNKKSEKKISAINKSSKRSSKPERKSKSLIRFSSMNENAN